MAYAAYNSTSPNPPVLDNNQPIAGPKSWLFGATETALVIQSSTHITDAQALGMKPGDRVTYFLVNASGGTLTTLSTAISQITSHYVTRVAATSCNLSTGVVLASST